MCRKGNSAAALAITQPIGDEHRPSSSWQATMLYATTLADWQTANRNAFDQASVAVAPQLGAVAAGRLLPGAAALAGAAMPLAQASEDVTAATRSLMAPAVGAYEFRPAVLGSRPTAGHQELTSEPRRNG